MAEKLDDWYPTAHQLTDPTSLERAFRQVLRLHYSQRDTVSALHAKVNAPAIAPATAGTKASQVPQVSTAAVTNVLGLPIVPSDTTQLADATVLTYDKAGRRFIFK